MFSCTTIAFATGDNTAFIPSNGYERGDVNMDSNINISDVIWVLKHIVGIIALDNKQRSYTDIDLNNALNALGTLYIKK